MTNGAPENDLRIAIVGISTRFPGAATLDEFWRNLCAGEEAITFFSQEELIAAGVDLELSAHPNYVPARAILPDIENFDARFFGLSPSEAALLDPQQRLLLECASEALDTSGCARNAELRPCGVYAGVGMNGYVLHNLWANRALFESTGGFQVMLGNDKDFCATRVWYRLNLRGPSLSVQTACSSSLVAVHLACQALLHGECDLALAGGCAVFVPQRSGYLYEPGMILSPDGHCRPFDASARGTVAGSGAAFVVLKRLDDAIADCDCIRAVILGSAINNDGGVKMAYTAPSSEGQRAVIAEAFAVAGVDPETVGFIEAHGTGTLQGDPIEFDALRQVFRSVPHGRCALGSVKSNIGHLDTAAGVAGLVKVVLALEHGVIPGTVHFREPIPALDLERSPFFVPASPVPWNAACRSPRRAGVSSFGIGGTNAHVVLEQAPMLHPSKHSRSHYPLVLCAKTATALEGAAAELADHLERTPDSDIADVAFALNDGRRLYAHRRLIAVPDRAGAIAQLRRPALTNNTREDEVFARCVAFLFPGQGAQFPGMARELYAKEASFCKQLDHCAEILVPELGCDLRDVIFTGAATIHETRFAQPALFAIEYALAQCLIQWRVRPDAMLGHSLGEWVAACLAGVMSLEDALHLVATRARLMQAQPAGAMLSVQLSEAAIAEYLGGGVDLAAVNAPDLCTLSGPPEAIAALARRLTAIPLKTSHAFHSAMMEPVVQPLLTAFDGVKLQPPSIPFVSNLTGGWITTAEATDPRYWTAHLREPVRFAEGIRLLFRDAEQLLLEIGPGGVLSTLAAHNSAPATQPVLRTFAPSGQDESRHLAETIGRLHMAGVRVDWKCYHAGENPRRVWLPPHPFQRERCWIDAAPMAAHTTSSARRDISEWLYLPAWRRSVLAESVTPVGLAGTWCFVGQNETAGQLAELLRSRGATIVEDCGARDIRGVIVFEQPAINGSIYRGFFDLADRARALGARQPAGKLDLVFLTRGLYAVSGGEQIDARRAIALGALRVIPQEYPAITCRHIDVDTADPCRIIAELEADTEPFVAYRGPARWVPSFEEIRLRSGGKPAALPEGGVCLITGGLGGIGLTLARHLGETCRAKLILVSRTVRPTERLRGLEAFVAAVDVADENQMRAAITEGERRFGRINAVIHAAGIASGGVLAGKTPESAVAVLRAKVDGTLVLDRLLRNHDLDFMVLCSSVTGWLGGFGQADYCAANTFLNAFAEQKSAEGRRVVAIAWDAWRDVGMAVETDAPAELRKLREQELQKYGISPADGAEIFRHALRLELPQVIVSTRDFAPRYAERNVVSVEKLASSSIENRQPRPALNTPFVAPRDAIERRIAERWCENLGFSEIGIEDNYFDLGGDSLKGITLAAHLQKDIGAAVHVGMLFEAPTIAQLAKRLAGERLAITDAISRLPRDGGDATFPMSSGQRRLWFLHDLADNGATYHMPAALRIRGPLDFAALAKCHREIIRRHETLRTVFRSSDGHPVQTVLPETEFELSVIEAESLPRDLMRKTAQEPFDLATGPLIRALLVRFSAEDHLWLLTVHHIVSDAWSMSVFVREMGALYRQHTRGGRAVLPELSIQYAEYACWQQEWLRSEAAARQLSWWRTALAGAPPLLTFPIDRSRPPLQTNRGARLQFTLGAALTGRLKAVARNTNGTLFTTLLAGFSALLSRYTGSEDVVLGTPTAGRTRPELVPLIGFFVNNLVLRLDFSNNPTFGEILEQARQRFVDAIENQDVPFEKVVEAVQPPRDLGYSPLFQVMFGLLNIEAEALDWPDLTIEPVDLDHESAAFDLTLLMTDTPAGLVGDFEYNIDLFDEETVTDFGQHFELLLDVWERTPELRLREIPLMEAAEQVGAESSASESVEELFAGQVARSPDANAIVTDARTMTYAELDREAERIARVLAAHGIGPECAVALCARRSPQMIAALLGIFKAGAAYVPLDPAYPRERLEFMLRDAGVSAVLVDEASNGLFTIDARVFILEHLDEAASIPSRKAIPSNLAYLIYTSGSTGQPKAVMVERRAVSAFVQAAAHAYAISPADRVLQFASISFDAAIEEIFPTLISGGVIVLRGEEWSSDAVSFLAVCAEHRVTVLDLPTAFWHRLAADLNGASFPPALRLVIIGGEEARVSSVGQWHAKAPNGVRLMNTYGPTEATVVATCCDVSDAARERVPIGWGLPHVHVHLLDDCLQPVPPNMTGEICIGGVGVARGYRGRADRTGERFVPDPFSQTPGARLYRTGDLARRRRDGTLEFVGRVDRQIKLRGHRIELAEIEAALAGHPAISQAMAVVCEYAPGDKRLVAYVVPRNGNAPSPTVLRDWLKQRLPAYLLPATVVPIAAFPTTVQGKIDHDALPAPFLELMPEPSSSPPCNTTEERLVRVWAEVLRISPPGIHDNFFDLGGDSILALQLAAQARAAGVRFTSRQLFERQTIAQLAAVAQLASPEQACETEAGPVPLTPIQRWFFEEAFADPHHFNQAVMLDIAPVIEAAHLEAALRALVKKHDALRMLFDRGEARALVPAEAVASLCVEVVDLRGMPRDAQPAAIAEAASQWQTSLALEAGPIFRVVLFRLEECAPGRLLWILHHLVVDGVSWRILLRDLEVALSAILRGADVVLTPAPVSFQRWAHRLAAAAREPRWGEELAYWRRLARRGITPLSRTTGGLRGDARTLTAALDAGTTTKLLRETAKAYGCEHDDLLLTALATALTEWTGDDQIFIDLESHGRDGTLSDLDVSETVGWFTAVHPICLRCDQRAPLCERLRRTREQRMSVPRRGLGYGLLRYLHPNTSVRDEMAAMPKSDVLFNYFGQLDAGLPSSQLLLGRAREDAGPMASPRQHQTHGLEINTWVASGCLTSAWTYDPSSHDTASIERVGAAFNEALRAVAAQCPAVPPAPRTAGALMDSARQKKLAAALQKADRAAVTSH